MTRSKFSETQAIGILHTFISSAMGCPYLRSFHQLPQGGCGFNLPAMPAKGMYAGVKRRIRSLGRFGRQRTCHKG